MGSQQQLLRDIRVPHSSLRQHTTAIYYRKFLFSLHHTWFHGSRTKPSLNEITMRGQGRIGIGDRPREKWRRSRSSEFFYPFSSETDEFLGRVVDQRALIHKFPSIFFFLFPLIFSNEVESRRGGERMAAS